MSAASRPSASRGVRHKAARAPDQDEPRPQATHGGARRSAGLLALLVLEAALGVHHLDPVENLPDLFPRSGRGLKVDPTLDPLRSEPCAQERALVASTQSEPKALLDDRTRLRAELAQEQSAAVKKMIIALIAALNTGAMPDAKRALAPAEAVLAACGRPDCYGNPSRPRPLSYI